jgi:hypothetical protein
MWGVHLMDQENGMQRVPDDELSLVSGGSIWSGIKSAARWVKDHVVLGLKSIGIKGKF